MATPTRHKKDPVPDAEVDILIGSSTDRLHLRFSGTFAPCRYLYEADGTTHVLNDAGEWAIEMVGESFTFWPTLAKVFALQTKAAQALRNNMDKTLDAAITTDGWEALKVEAETKWDSMVAAYNADPENLDEPTVEALAEAVGCTRISGAHPFTA